MQYNYIARFEGSNLQVLTQVPQRGGGSNLQLRDLTMVPIYIYKI